MLEGLVSLEEMMMSSVNRGVFRIKRIVVGLVRRIFSALGLGLIRSRELKVLQLGAAHARKIRFLNRFEFHPHHPQIELIWEKSTSQLCQDLFVLVELGFPRDGYFVEFGATDGVSLSNTFLLEKEFGWDGILAEPARSMESSLVMSRACAIDKRAVWRTTGETLMFRENAKTEFSSIASYRDNLPQSGIENAPEVYPVETVSLEDLLRFHNAPTIIDYLSIDTEGSEWEILRDFDFALFTFRVITVEHNYGPHRQQIQKLLVANGYKKGYPELSYFDDWYVR